MSEASSHPPTAAVVPGAAPVGLGENKGIKFHIKTGNSTWRCTLQDRSHYERTKATRTNSTDSVDSAASSVSGSSH